MTNESHIQQERNMTPELPLSEAQEGIWLGHQRAQDPSIYNVGQVLFFEQSASLERLNRAILSTRREARALHVGFIERRGTPRIISVDESQSKSGLIETPGEKFTREEILIRSQRELERAFDLESGELWRNCLLERKEGGFAWIYLAHHIALDGYGMNLVLRRVAEWYSALQEGRSPRPAPFDDLTPVLEADQRYRQGPHQKKDSDTFREQLQQQRGLSWGPSVAPERPRRASVKLDKKAVSRIKNEARELGLAWTDCVLAVTSHTVSRWSQTQQFVLGLPTMLRFATPALKVPCMAMNIVPMPIRLAEGESAVETAQQISNRGKTLKPHNRCRYESLRTELPSRKIFGPVVNIMPFDFPGKFGSEQVDVVELSGGPVEDLSLSLIPKGSEWLLHLDAHARLFSQRETTALLNNWREALELGMTSHLGAGSSNRTISRAKSISIGDRLRLLAKTCPDKPAMESSLGCVWTYGQLASALTCCCEELRALELTSPSLVGLMLHPGPSAVVMLLSCLELGYPYVPLDPHLPPARLMQLVEQSSPALIIVEEHDLQLTVDSSHIGSSPRRFVFNEELVDSWRKQERYLSEALIHSETTVAYVIFTSGSTGVPKGVEITHEALARFIGGALERYPIDEETRLLSFARLSFDASVEEIFCSLAAGACLVFKNEEMLQSAQRFFAACQERQINALDLPTSYFHELAYAVSSNEPPPSCLRTVIIGGEAAHFERVETFLKWAPDLRLFNTYGPSEATVVATCAELQLDNLRAGMISLGKPLSGVEVKILREDGTFTTEPGDEGELILTGKTLAKGYLDDPGQTKEKFFRLKDGERAYRTGDTGSFSWNRELIFSGRIDSELKIGGQRIAPAEVEAALSSCPQVRANAVCGLKHHGRLLLACVVEADESVTELRLREFLAHRLPPLMVPSLFHFTKKMPLGPTGKIDREAVQEISEALPAVQVTESPANSTLERVLSAWQEVLGVKAKPHDNFFELGGNSLQVIQLANRLGKEFREVRVADLFRLPTATSQSSWIQDFESTESTLAPFKPHNFSEFSALQAQVTEVSNDVLLTGASGFVGVHLLDALLRQGVHVHCLIRASNNDEARLRIEHLARKYGIQLLRLEKLLHVHCLTGHERRSEALKNLPCCSKIIHCAAQVSLTRDYASLLDVNVRFTHELLELALAHGSEFHFISTIATLPSGELSEKFTGLHEELDDGYRQSKAHAEELCLRAAQKGLHLAIHRLGRVVGARHRPHINENDIVWRVARSASRIGYWPNIAIAEPWAPVDELSESIVALIAGGAAQSKGAVYHLVQHGTVALADVGRALQASGYELNTCPLSEWIERLTETADAQDQATLAFFELRRERKAKQGSFLPSCQATRSLLAPHQAHPRPVDQALLAEYCRSAGAHGLLERSHRPQHSTSSP